MELWDPAAYLKTRHTRVLMQMRVSAYRCGGGTYRGEYGNYRVGCNFRTDEEIVYDPFGDHRCYVSLAQIKAELATRPHVPNKREARVIRQQRAKRRK